MSSTHKPHPIMIIAALSLIILSMTGVAAMLGWLPNSHSQSDTPSKVEDAKSATAESAGAKTAKSKATEPVARNKLAASEANANREASPKPAHGCADCGVVESVNVVEVEGKGTGVGAVAGGVLGGLLGNQIGQGRGNTVATVAGVAGGAYAGHEVEKNMKKTHRYDIIVRMDDGTTRTFHQRTDPGLVSGDKVRIANGGVVRD